MDKARFQYNKYNNTLHNTMQTEPNKATLASNFLWVAWHLQNVAKQSQKYTGIFAKRYG